MAFDGVSGRGLVLLGCGKMGSAMLGGWLARGLEAESVWVIEPHPSDWLRGLGVHLNAGLPERPAVAILAVKPQMMGAALPALAALAALGGGGTLFLSIAAGVTLARLEQALGVGARIVRSMPNTPAAIGRGISAMIGNAHAGETELRLAESLLSAVGQTLRLEDEAQMDAVTAVSGSGPAYVFHLIEALADAARAQGLPEDMAMRLAKATVGGAGALAEAADEDPAQLRVNVTSPGGTTAAALEVLMDPVTGFPALLNRAVAAAADRSRELGK
jgi:pyrroline-5-carboxylate reductase